MNIKDYASIRTPDDRLFTTKEAAKFLGVSKSFLEKDRLNAQRIPFITVGSRRLYSLHLLIKYLDENTVSKTPSGQIDC